MTGFDEALFSRTRPRNEVFIYADGSGSAKTRTGGWSWILVYKDEIVRHGYNENVVENTTTNKMELMAAIQGLLGYVEWEDKPKDHTLTVVSDSEYVVISAAQRLERWERKGWRTNDGPVKNLPEWKAIKKLMEIIRFQIGWGHTRGHVGNRWNEIVDKLANYKMSSHDKAREWNRIASNGFYDKPDHTSTEFKRYL